MRSARHWPLWEISRTDKGVGACYSGGVTLVCRVVSPIIGVTLAAITWAITYVVTLAAGGGGRVGASDAFVPSMSQTWIHQDRAFQIRG